MIKVKTRTILVGVILSLLIAFLGGWYYGYQKEKKAAEIALNSLKDTIQKLTVQINDTEYYLTRAEQELITERQLRKQDIFEKGELKKLNLKQANEIARLNLRIDTLVEDIVHNGEIIVVQNDRINDLDNKVSLPTHKAIKLPFMFDKSDKWMVLKGNFDEDGKLGISLSMDLAINAVSGIDKTTKKPTLSLYTANPYIKTVSLASYKTDTPKDKSRGLGVQIGYGMIFGDPLKTAPYLGIGISRNIFCF